MKKISWLIATQIACGLVTVIGILFDWFLPFYLFVGGFVSYMVLYKMIWQWIILEVIFGKKK